MNIPTEILVIILGEMAAGQLRLFRSLRWAFRNFATANEYQIVFAALKNDLYRTASKLYYRHIYDPRPLRSTLQFHDLYQVARRCDSARTLALLLTRNYLMILLRDSGNAGIASNQAYSITKVAENIYPYIIGLFHFLEHYRNALVTFVPDPRHATSPQTMNSQIERRLLAQYNQETVYRLCCVYHVLLELFRRRIPRIRIITMSYLLRVPRPTNGIAIDACYLDIFVFGGLEAVRDVMGEASIRARVDHVLAHYSKKIAIPLPLDYDSRNYETLVSLPRPEVPELDHRTATDICRRLPLATDFLNIGNAALRPFSRLCKRDTEGKKFLRYLATHEGAEPKLLSQRGRRERQTDVFLRG